MSGTYEYDEPTDDPVIDALTEICRLARDLLEFVVLEWLGGTESISQETLVAEFSGGSYSEDDVRLAIEHIRTAARSIR